MASVVCLENMFISFPIVHFLFIYYPKSFLQKKVRLSIVGTTVFTSFHQRGWGDKSKLVSQLHNSTAAADGRRNLPVFYFSYLGNSHLNTATKCISAALIAPTKPHASRSAPSSPHRKRVLRGTSYHINAVPYDQTLLHPLTQHVRQPSTSPFSEKRTL